MKIIVGLGNPGEQYTSTRHNLGFMILDHFRKDFTSPGHMKFENNEKLKSELLQFDWQPRSTGSGPARPLERVLLVKPLTFMNNSGMAVQLVSAFYKIEPNDIWVVHDDLDLPLGKMKIRLGGAAAGHHGVEDIIEKLGTDAFWRFRLGIGEARHAASKFDGDGNEKMIAKKPARDTSDFVLSEFTQSDKSEVKKLIKYGSEALEVALEKGMESAMNRFNTK